jgi:hypothetical protein
MAAWLSLYRQGIKIRPALRTAHQAAKRILSAFIPTAIGLGIVQFNVLIDGVIAWHLSSLPGGMGAKTSQYPGAHLMQAGLAIFGTAAATTAFPYFCAHTAKKEYGLLAVRLLKSLKTAWALTLPAAALLIALADPLIRLLFQGPGLEFSHGAVYRTSLTTACYALGLGFFACQMSLTRVFYAREERAVVMKSAAVCAVINLCLNLILIHFPDLYRLKINPEYGQAWGLLPSDFPFYDPQTGEPSRMLGEAGLALSTTITAMIQCIYLWRKLGESLSAESDKRGLYGSDGRTDQENGVKKDGVKKDGAESTEAAVNPYAVHWNKTSEEALWSAGRIALAAVGAGILTLWFRNSLPYAPELYARAERLFIPAALGVLAYIAIGFVIPAPEITDFFSAPKSDKKDVSKKS